MKETLGRLYLWQIALNRIIDLLAFRQRVDRFCNTGRPLHITELYDNERRRLKTGLRLDGGALNSFEEEHGSLFPDIHDIQLIDELITEEIIIKFCTIFNGGHGKAGVIATNKKPFWKPILDEIILEAFSGDIKVKFNEFIEAAKAYRNKHGAHFDQESFIVTHGDKKLDEDGIIYSVGWSSALLNIDWGFVSDTIPVFNKSLNDYIKKLQKEAGII
ncbi:hypothetical protein QN386_06900 [Pseudomonas sp. CCI3.2]|uniref:hypothetical protein n=1 Tax=unclassified Pseudomonas TaxID=196821 RepID=UPI002B226FA1|nr:MULTISPECIES: hypothetical protein [unclassified Pseudomonas]MEB0076307.1 hypothetical protein [Pseudomonas sp. MH10out]MEB0101054.1 hypothetical protein [Pseudomonas sp. CCI3.2]MEB0128913.1 hypothetical protein [Pseudomonas sp. CCI2.4]